MSFAKLPKEHKCHFKCTWHDHNGILTNCRNLPYYVFFSHMIPYSDHAYCKIHGDRILYRMPRQKWTERRREQRQKNREKKRREATGE